jgi:hypothetical protein
MLERDLDLRGISLVGAKLVRMANNTRDARDDVLNALRSNGGAATNDDWSRIAENIDGSDDALALLLEQGIVFRDHRGNLRMRHGGVLNVESR